MGKEIGQLTMNNYRGIMHYVKIGSITCKKYEGEFVTPYICDRAATGKWYAFISGNPHVKMGEGDTPESAVQNLIDRTQERVQQMTNGVCYASKMLKSLS